MRVTDAQVRRLMEEMTKHGKIGRASMMSGMDRKTGRKYFKSGQFPSQTKRERDYRTREDPFERDWDLIKSKLKEAPALEGKALFEWLMERNPGRYEPGQVRTFQRKIKQWRALDGPDREIFFAQEHRPGEAMQTDFTNCNKLKVTICGEPFGHLLCHPVLPYSNWEWVSVCRSESMMALRRGIQDALFQLGRLPEYHQTDNSTAATHDLRTGKREFNEEYKALVEHLGMLPRTIAVGKSNQNGDVESLNNALKKRIKQHLLLRGSRDFESAKAYEEWLRKEVLARTNAIRATKINEELAVMRELSVNRLREYKEELVRVTRESTIRIMYNSYSMPSRLRGERVRVRVFDDRIEVFYGNIFQLKVERILGRHKHHIDYRHIIWSLVSKPGAFQRYRYRDDLFPSLVFRRAYDVLCEKLGSGYDADINYLRILHQAAAVSETDVEIALELLLSEGKVALADRVKEIVQPREPEVPEMPPLKADLDEYDDLLEGQAEVMS